MNLQTTSSPIPVSAGIGRIDFVDCARGIAIFLVVWVHTAAPPQSDPWDIGILADILFFFLSGIFFRPSSIREFIVNKPRQLLLPFIIFYILYIPVRVLEHYYDFRDITTFDWTLAIDAFRISNETLYLRSNAALWFLLTLFMIQAMGVVLFRLPRPIVFLTVILALLFRTEILSWPTLFMFNKALYWYAYFALGWLLGRKYCVALSENPRIRHALLISSALLFTGAVLLLSNDIITDYRNIVLHSSFIAFCIAATTICPIMIRLPLSALLTWIGRHSLEILCLHNILLVPLNRLYNKFIDSNFPLIGLLTATLVIIFLVPVINHINRHHPVLFGRIRH